MSNKKPIKITDEYEHHDLDEVNTSDLDADSFKTVHLPGGAKLVTAKEKTTNKVRGVRILIPKPKSSK